MYAAKTLGELVPITSDLPVSGAVTGPLRASGDGSGSPSTIAVFGGTERTGEWQIPAVHRVRAVFGGIRLDLRQVRLSAPVTTIQIIAVMGGVEITVPEGVTVEIEGNAVMGGFERRAAGHGPPGAPVIRITGHAVMGGVDVKRGTR
ncbi:MAG: LiaF domain-containing protein [Pseudonocardia sp.]